MPPPGARIWGVPVGVVARVGADFPAAALDRLREAGVDTLGLRPIAGPTVRNWVVYEARRAQDLGVQDAPGAQPRGGPPPRGPAGRVGRAARAYPGRPRCRHAVLVRRPHRRPRPGAAALPS